MIHRSKDGDLLLLNPEQHKKQHLKELQEMQMPKFLKICNCEHPILSNKETIEDSTIKCEVCGESKTTKKTVRAF